MNRIKLKIQLPGPEPEPPPLTCALCGKTPPYWQMTTRKPQTCWECTDRRRRNRWDGDYRDGSMVDAAMAVIERLETEHGPR